jgi:two-component system, cell cycle sensor histidine kinase and response regulator CckA
MSERPETSHPEIFPQGELSQSAGGAFGKPVKQLRVLLLEDVADDAELLQHELQKASLPCTTRCVATREDFVRALQEFSPDIVISDYTLPQFNALEALRLLCQTPLDIPFILVTGSQSEEVAVECMRQGVDDYILKTTLKRLPSAVQNTLQRKEAERERERAIRALRQSEEHFRSLIEHALDIIAILNPDGSFRYASPSVRVLGYTPEDLVGRSLLDFVNGDDARDVTNMLNGVFQHANETRTFDFLFRHSNGSWRMLESIGKSIYADSEIAGIVVNARDITERKQAEAAIEKLASFPRLNPNPIFEVAADGHVNYFNQAAEEVARSLGKTSPAEILPVDLPDIIQECLHTGRSNLRRETSIGNRILSWSFFPIISSHVVHCYAVDISERLSLEAQLRHSQKMESIGQLAAGVAHDFNNILTIIRGYSGLLLDREDLSYDLTEPIQQISIASERAANLTRQLLMFSRKQVMQPKEIDLNEIISNVTRLLRRVLGEDITLHFNYSPNLPAIYADSGMIEQVIMNLAVNARDAMPRGGQLTVGTSLAEINQVHVKANPEAAVGHFVCLRVTDTGMGIPPSHMTRIFEPFFTTKEVGKGTGLGLATVYGIAKQHRGWIEVLSREGQGTTFRVFLPSRPRAKTEAVIPPEPQKVRGGNENILVVEDEPELRALVREILEHYGYKVYEAGSGPEAIPIWQQHAGQIDLLLTDMVMPGNMSGHELAEKLKSQRPGLKVIYTSGYSVDVVGKDFLFKRGLNFLQKPYHPLTLAKVVRECLDT